MADLGPAVGRLLEALLRDLPADAPVALFPWDLRPGNAILRDDRVAALLDWGDRWPLRRGLSLAKTDYLTTDWYFERDRVKQVRAGLHDGYREATGLPPRYRERQRDTVLEWVRRYNESAPVVTGLDVGHTTPVTPLPVGGRVRVDADAEHIEFPGPA